METQKNDQHTIDLGKVFRTLWSQKKRFIKVWVWTFVLSCIWILPQPRYYTSDVKLAPEMSGESAGGGLASIASSFGFDLGGMGGQDAIYPELYPELFESPEFIVGLYSIRVKTKDGDLSTDYFTYMKQHQKENPLTFPFRWVMKKVKLLFEEQDATPRATGGNDINPFLMNRKDYGLMETVMRLITCAVDKKTSVVTITVKDQDALISATMADSVKQHLQDFIIRYRTSKVAEDLMHYEEMRDSAEHEYDVAMAAYSRFCDAHKNTILQSMQSERDKLENDLIMKQNSLTAMETQLQATKVKLQEKTPAFTTLKSAIVPVKPSAPKRMLFVLMMLVLVSIGYACMLCREEIFGIHK
ncbi:MAG: chain-length determining protein [Bacteroidaceae bacterium]|nr:chain-length determining protein [Bacteroidaceae bacterium]